MRIRAGWIPNCSTMAVCLNPVTLSPEQLLKGVSEYFTERSQKRGYKVRIYHRYKATSDKPSDGVYPLHLFDFRTVEEFSTEEIDTDELLKRRAQQEATAPREQYLSTELAIETEYGSIQYDGERFETWVTKLGTSPREDWMTELYPYLRQFERILFWDGYGESEHTGYDLAVTFFGNE